MIGVAFILLVGYLFIEQWVRVSVFIIAGVVWLNISGFTHFSGAMVSAVSANSFTQQTNTSIDQPQPQNTEILSTAQTRVQNNNVLSSPYPPQNSQLITKC